MPTPTDRPFVDPTVEPTDEAIDAILGPTAGRYRSILGTCQSFGRSWNYSKSSGWMLTVSDRQKAFLYLIPLRGAFKVSLTIRETERAILMADPQLAGVRDRIEAARRYPEGYGLFFEVVAGTDVGPLLALLGKLAELRTAG